MTTFDLVVMRRLRGDSGIGHGDVTQVTITVIKEITLGGLLLKSSRYFLIFVFGLFIINR